MVRYRASLEQVARHVARTDHHAAEVERFIESGRRRLARTRRDLADLFGSLGAGLFQKVGGSSPAPSPRDQRLDAPE